MGIQKSLKISFIILLIFICTPLHALAPNPIINVFPARDGCLLRYGYWPHDPQVKLKGVFFIMEGMAGFAELYQETAEILAGKGYEVYALDWRGQGGSTRSTNVSTLLHVNDFQLYLDDVDDFYHHLHLTNPIYIFAISMGGHLAYRFAHDHPEKIKGLILLAPMFQIKTSPYPLFLAKALAEAYVAVGFEERFVFGFNPHDFKGCVNNYDERKHGDMSRYIDRCNMLVHNPVLAVEGPSFGWLKAAFVSTDVIMSPGYAESLIVPTLIVISEYDHLVDNEIQKYLCAKMPRCESRFYEKGHHNVLMDSDSIRTRLWDDFDSFISRLEMGNVK